MLPLDGMAVLAGSGFLVSSAILAGLLLGHTFPKILHYLPHTQVREKFHHD